MRYLQDYGEVEFKKMIDFLSTCTYGEVKDIEKLISNYDTHEYSYKDVQAVYTHYDKLKMQYEESEKIEEYFLDWIDTKKYNTEFDKYTATFTFTCDNEISNNIKMLQDVNSILERHNIDHTVYFTKISDNYRKFIVKIVIHVSIQ